MLDRGLPKLGKGFRPSTAVGDCSVEAIDLDDGGRSVAFAVKGFGEAGRAAEELARTISTSDPPHQLPQGTRTPLPRPTF